MTNLGTTSVTTAYRFLRGDEVLLEAELRHVFVDREHRDQDADAGLGARGAYPLAGGAGRHDGRRPALSSSVRARPTLVVLGLVPAACSGQTPIRW